MHRISIHTEGLATSAATTTGLATDVAAITTRTATAAPDLLAPAFGLIGTDFLTAYAAAHATHLAALAGLTTNLAATAAAIDTAATAYCAHDDACAAALHGRSTEWRA